MNKSIALTSTIVSITLLIACGAPGSKSASTESTGTVTASLEEGPGTCAGFCTANSLNTETGAYDVPTILSCTDQWVPGMCACDSRGKSVKNISSSCFCDPPETAKCPGKCVWAKGDEEKQVGCEKSAWGTCYCSAFEGSDEWEIVRGGCTLGCN